MLLAKHLCGAGTDVALRCALQCGGGGGGGAAGGEEGGRPRLLGVAVAPCCHHRCTFGAYVNRPFLQRLGASAAAACCFSLLPAHGGCTP